jgi:uncharacterized Zn finger protein
MTNYQIESKEWWVQRWLELLDSYRFKKRLERARIYAREGNVLSIEFQGAQVLAKVQGSEAEPYQVSLSLDPFSEEDWNYVIETMSQKALFSAQLLAGEMPENIEKVFTSNGLSLFPFTLSDIHSRCSCPDKANPCKHIGAVYYQLGDRFSEDPFVLFQLRGLTKTEILQRLRQLRSKNTSQTENREARESVTKDREVKPLLQDSHPSLTIENFWKYDEPLESSLVVISSLPEMKATFEVLGTITLAYADTQTVKQYLSQVYQSVSQQAVKLALDRQE